MQRRSASAAAAFVFDIDGVITCGSVLECAKAAFATLLDASRRQLRVPVVFVTNGGGVQEAHKAAELSEWLQVPIGEEQVVLSHSPLRSVLPALGAQQSATLLCGRGDLKAIGRSVGLSTMVRGGGVGWDCWCGADEESWMAAAGHLRRNRLCHSSHNAVPVVWQRGSEPAGVAGRGKATGGHDHRAHGACRLGAGLADNIRLHNRRRPSL